MQITRSKAGETLNPIHTCGRFTPGYLHSFSCSPAPAPGSRIYQHRQIRRLRSVAARRCVRINAQGAVMRRTSAQRLRLAPDGRFAQPKHSCFSAIQTVGKGDGRPAGHACGNSLCREPRPAIGRVGEPGLGGLMVGKPTAERKALRRSLRQNRRQRPEVLKAAPGDL